MAFPGLDNEAKATVNFMGACKATGLSEDGLHELPNSAAPDKLQHEARLMVALHKRMMGRKLNVVMGWWIAVAQSPAPQLH